MAAGKRKAETAIRDEDESEYSDASDYAPSAIDVSFNYVSPTLIDFAALKRLTQQLYHTHSPDLNLTALVDEIQAWGDKSVGTVVKVEDDEDGDPFAFASVIQLHKSSTSEASKTLIDYYFEQASKVASASSSSSPIDAALSIKETISQSTSKVLQIFHERMINLPPQIMPPLYKMLFEEIKRSDELKSSTHLLFFSRVFSISAIDEEVDEEENAMQMQKSTTKSNGGKKQKRGVAKNNAIAKMKGSEENGEKELGLFHPEDAIIAKHAIHTLTYKFAPVKNSDESFNAPMFARIALIKRDDHTFQKLLSDIEEAFAVPL